MAELSGIQHANINIIKQEDLPFSCPQKVDSSWGDHPRVYLSLKPQQITKCPYCGKSYQLK